MEYEVASQSSFLHAGAESKLLPESPNKPPIMGLIIYGYKHQCPIFNLQSPNIMMPEISGQGNTYVVMCALCGFGAGW